jgi:imidazolonepropionase-like amidohydrolase
MLLFSRLVLIAAAAVLGAPSHLQAQPPSTLAIVGADVLPMTGAPRLIDQTVIIRGERIISIGPRDQVPLPGSAHRIDASGLTLMPGLVDMHVHLPPEPGEPGDEAQRALAVMLAHGTTTARGMAGESINFSARDSVERGSIAGPRLYLASEPLNDRMVETPDAARAAVRKAKTAGFDFVKSHHLTEPPVWLALQDEARKLGLSTGGHLANEIGLVRGLAAGQQIEHLDGAMQELLSAARPGLRVDYAQFPPPAVLAALASADDALFDALARRVAAAKSYQVPTLSLFEKVVTAVPSTDELMRGPAMRYVSPVTVREWAAQREQLKQAGLTPEQATNFIDIRRRIVRAYHRAGVPLMAGSDTAQFFHVWGPGLVEEIEALAAAGLTPMEALRAATVIPRDYFRSLPNGGSSLGWKADFGTIEPGARADLILLRGDPSKNLSSLREIESVIAGGRHYSRAALDSILRMATADAKKGN